MNISLIILAGGFSRRMGVFKPMLPVNGIPAVLRCVQVGKESGVCEILVITGHMRKKLEEALAGLASEVKLIHNEDYDTGMFSSVCTGVKALSNNTQGFFLLPADCCAVTPETLTTLVSAFADSEGRVVVRPKFEGRRGHPPLIPAVYKERLLSYGGEAGLKAVLRALPTFEVEMKNPASLFDMDTPDDYAQLLSFLGLRNYPTPERCEQLLSEYAVSQQIVEHGEAVAALACKLASHMNARGAEIDIPLLRSACLLHDIRRASPKHAQAGKELLLCEGFPEAAMLISEHMDLSTPVTSITERELLYLADKLCRGGKIVGIEHTICELSDKYTSEPEAQKKALERMESARDICDMFIEKYGKPDFLKYN